MSETQNEKHDPARLRGRLVRLAAILIGALLWIMLSAASGRAEAWDSASYWSFGFPLLLLSAFLFGWFCRERPAPAGAWIGVGHGLGVLITGIFHGSGFDLWPMTLITILIFSGMLAVCAIVGGLLARLWHKKA